MNLGNLLNKAMELEKLQRILYEGLEKKFSFSKEISTFWREMAEDEKKHYANIKKLRGQASPAQLSMEVDDELQHLVCKGLNELMPKCLAKVFTLDDAYNLASQIESYETGPVFRFLSAMFKSDTSYGLEILPHLDKLAVFPDKFGSANERKIIRTSP